tara:strand:+ start:31 stop:201 length:171 start_codon:yes stop_codon:yes gene_type:complete
MDISLIGEIISTWINEEWYMAFFALFSVIFIFMMIKMAREIGSSKKFPRPKENSKD